MKSKIPAPFRVIGRTFVDWWDSWFDLLGVVIVWLLAQITIVLGPPATFGLYHVAYSLANGESLGIRGLIEGGRRYFGVAWLWNLINLFVFVTLFINFEFYGQFEGDWRFFIQVTMFFMILLWAVVQFYTLPFFFELKEPKILLAIRNALFTALASPLFTLILMIVVIVVFLVCAVIVLPVFLGVPAIIPLLGVRALQNRLETFGIRAPEKTPKELEQEESGSRIKFTGQNISESERQVKK